MTMKALLLSAAIVALPFAASAATVYTTAVNPASVTASYSFTLNPGGQVTYTFAPTVETTFYFTFSATGQQVDLANVSYGFFEHDNFFSDYTVNGPIFGASAGFSFTTSEAFSVGFFDGVSSDVGTTFTYYAIPETTPPVVSPVPLPAAGLLLGGVIAALGGTAAVRRRKA